MRIFVKPGRVAGFFLDIHSNGLASFVATMEVSFAMSSALPPPSPMTRSKSPDRTCSRSASAVPISGSGSTPLKLSTFNPASLRESATRPA